MRKTNLLGASAVVAALIAFAAAGPAMAQANGMNPATMHGNGMGPGMMGGNGMGPSMMNGTGMGPGMMYGTGMMNGTGMGPGMMYGYGRGAMMGNPAMGDSGYVRPVLHLSVADVKGFFERWLEQANNPNIKVGKVTEKDANTIEVQIVTKDNSLVQTYEVARDTGFFHPA